MVRHHPQALAHDRLVGAGREVDGPVLLGELPHDGPWVLEDVAVAAGRVAAEEVAREGLGAGVYHAALGRRLAHQRHVDVQGAIFQRGRAGGDAVAIVVDVSARAVLRRHARHVRPPHARRAAYGYDPQFEARLPEQLAGPSHEARHHVGVGVREEAEELDVRPAGGGARQRDGLLRRHDALAPLAALELDEHADRAPRERGSSGDGVQGDLVVHRHPHGRHARHLCQAPHLVGAHHVVGDEDVVQPGRGHDLRLADALHGYAARARLDLPAREERELVRLDVGAVGYPVRVEVLLQAPDVALHHVEVDDQARGVERLDAHGGRHG